MRSDPSGFSPLTVAGDGFFDVYITLDPPPHMRFPRHTDRDRVPQAVTLKGADLEGGPRDGRTAFEINSYAPPGVVESDGDRCLLASLEFQAVNLSSSAGGRLYLCGFLSGAETYDQDVHDRIMAGTPLPEIEELAGDYGDVRYLPPRYTPLEEYFGWEATVRLVPRTASETA
ncbi:hypothetical protein [Arthrobacter sp. UYCo732]|uniref:hypothetical protein n=1 Tax=Arthrobacter sp. UYCo732 TaxID=3156336 RepID=UPI003394C4FB